MSNTKNKLSDLNDHLFLALERLNDDSLPPERIQEEVCRASAITGVADKIIANAKVTIDAMKLVAHGDVDKIDLPDSFQPKKIEKHKTT